MADCIIMEQTTRGIAVATENKFGDDIALFHFWCKFVVTK
jgi:hypothetical protein